MEGPERLLPTDRARRALGTATSPGVTPRTALPLYQQTRPLMEQRRRWLAIARSVAPRRKVSACPAGSVCGPAQTRVFG
jgi:hypothetical protein